MRWYYGHMVVRTVGKLLVSEESLERVLSILERSLAGAGLVYRIEVGLVADPEDEALGERTMVRALVLEGAPLDQLTDLLVEVAEGLRAEQLLHPAIPLELDIVPTW